MTLEGLEGFPRPGFRTGWVGSRSSVPRRRRCRVWGRGVGAPLALAVVLPRRSGPSVFRAQRPGSESLCFPVPCGQAARCSWSGRGAVTTATVLGWGPVDTNCKATLGFCWGSLFPLVWESRERRLSSESLPGPVAERREAPAGSRSSRPPRGCGGSGEVAQQSGGPSQCGLVARGAPVSQQQGERWSRRAGPTVGFSL